MTRLSLAILLFLAGCRAPGPVALVAPPANGKSAVGITASAGATAGRYLYSDCRILKTTDGDTFVVALPERVRLLGIDCPELSTTRGVKAKEAAERLVASATASRVRTDGIRDIYSRLLGSVELRIGGRWIDLATELKRQGFVK